MLFKMKVNNRRKNIYEFIRNKYEFDETDNIATPNVCWFILKTSKIDSKMNRYKLNPGEIIKIGRITMRIRDIIFADKNNTNRELNDTKGTNYNIKEIQTLKTEGEPYTIINKDKNNKNNKNEEKSLEKTEKIIIKKHTKNQKDIFTKLEKKNKVCRICYLEEENDKDPLVQPCICSGSMKFIHLSCLKQWIGTRSCIRLDKTEDCSIFLIKPVECELCKTKFPDYIKHEGILYPLLDFKMEFQSYLTLESLTLDKQKNKFIYAISLEKSRKIKVGRGHESNVVLSDISVSRIHCYMAVENKNVFLEDNDSKFGTLVLVQTPSIKIVDDLPLYIQIGRTFFECKIQKPFKLFNCCDAEEKNNIYYYYNQNEKYIKDNFSLVVKPDIYDDDEEDNVVNNTFEQKYPVDIAKKFKVNNDSIKINDGDKMSDNEYILLKHNQKNRDIKKTMIYNEENEDEKNKKKEKEEENKNDEENNNNEVEEVEEIEDESGDNDDNNATASMNNFVENQSITVSENNNNQIRENNSTLNG